MSEILFTNAHLSGQPGAPPGLARVWVRRAVFEYIEIDYNRTRRHSANGYRSPLAFESQKVA